MATFRTLPPVGRTFPHSSCSGAAAGGPAGRGRGQGEGGREGGRDPVSGWIPARQQGGRGGQEEIKPFCRKNRQNIATVGNIRTKQCGKGGKKKETCEKEKKGRHDQSGNARPDP